MDQGPVDAGPSADSVYNDVSQSPSPQRDQLSRPKGEGPRSTSARRGEGAIFERELAYSTSKARGEDDDSAQSLDDPPQYPRVGDILDQESIEASIDGATGSKHESRREIEPMNGLQQVRHRIYKFMLYETNSRYWITGADLADRSFRLLRIDRTSAPGQIAIFEDETLYTRSQLNDVLASIDEGNKQTGGLRLRCTFWGLLGFIRFTEAFYMLIVTQRQQVAMVGGHYIYQVEGTELIPLTTGSSSRFARDRNPEETKFLGILGNLDLNKSFYFSYSYDITHSLQHNIIRQRAAMNAGDHGSPNDFNDMWVWNHHLLGPAKRALKHPFDWCVPIIHGFIDQAALDIFSRAVYITIIGRRSRHFAGARFLKRGVNDSGYVANDVETEQIVSEKLTTSFHAPGPRMYASPNYTSYLHYRGSIPLYWAQENSGVTPKPDIELNLQDPFFQPAALHFDNLFERYGCPIYVLNLIKARERTPRESKLLTEYQKSIDYLNQALPTDKQILYKAFDMSRASKTRGGDVIGCLEVIAKELVEKTGIFRNGDPGFDEPQLQNGIARTNCIDCLDRTNAAQFVIGKRAFALQLQALGVIDRDEVDFDTDAVNIFTHMFHAHGDTIAVQYGGSHLVNTMATYRKLNHWQSSSRDMVESFKRYYHNSFLDSQRQEAYNLFLGNYVWAQGEPMLWDLSTDYYLHHSSPRAWMHRKRRDYIQWYTPEYLEPRTLPPKPIPAPNESLTMGEVGEYDDYWLECYRPAVLSNLGKVFSYRMNSTNRYLSDRPAHRDSKYDFSPFKIRRDPHRHSHDSPDKTAAARRKGVKIVDPHDAETPDATRPATATGGLKHPPNSLDEKPSILREPTIGRLPTPYSGKPEQPSPIPADKAQMHLWTLNEIHRESLAPSVTDAEAREYERYISHPLKLPLVVSTGEVPSSDANIDYIEYVNKVKPNAYDDGDEDGVEGGGFAQGVSERDLQHFWEFVAVREEPLTVTEEDGAKKRYKAYKQWLRGKSLFKQSKVDPEYQRAGT